MIRLRHTVLIGSAALALGAVGSALAATAPADAPRNPDALQEKLGKSAWNRVAKRGGTIRPAYGRLGGLGMLLVAPRRKGARVELRRDVSPHSRLWGKAILRLNRLNLPRGKRRALIVVHGKRRSSYRAGVMNVKGKLRWATWGTTNAGRATKVRLGGVVRRQRWYRVSLGTAWNRRSGRGELYVDGRRVARTPALNRRANSARSVVIGLSASKTRFGRARMSLGSFAISGTPVGGRPSPGDPGPGKPATPTPGPSVPTGPVIPPYSPAPGSGSPFFAANSVWNQPLASNAPIDARSSALVGEFNNELNGPAIPWINTTEWSVPIYTVPGGHPSSTVSLSGTQWAPLVNAWQAVPIPGDAQPAGGSDGHLVVWQPETDTMWEFWRLNGSGSSWSAGWGGRMQNVSGSTGIYPDKMGGTATSVPLVAGLLTLDELERGEINHALALAVPNPRKGHCVAPIHREDGTSSDPNALPEGAHLRLPASLDVEAMNVPEATKVIARAAQRYGMILRDKSGSVSLYGEDPRPSGRYDVYEKFFGGLQPDEIMEQFPWDQLQVLEMDLNTNC